MVDENIIVIGAGASGLMAARELAKAGKRVTILEAKAKVGGRIWDVPSVSGNGHFMLGAEFIHGNAELTFTLLKEAGITYQQVAGKSYNAVEGKLSEGNDEIDLWPEFMEKLSDLKEDMALADFLDRYFSEEQHASFRESVIRFAEGFDAADTHRVSVLSLQKEWAQDDEQQFRIDGGYGRLIDFLEQECINLGVLLLTHKVVSHFNWSSGYVEAVTVGGERYAGKRAIITLPLGVLQVKDGSLGSITLSPPLPIRMGALRAMGFGAVIKVIVKFSRTFWPADAGFIFGDQAIPVWWTQHPEPSTVITGWLGGPPVEKYKDFNELSLIELGLQSLSAILGKSVVELREHLIEAYATNWLEQPFSRGAYTYITVADPNAGVVLSNPVQETLYFSGEATFSGPQVGTVEAALISGKEAARRILNS